MRLFAVSLTGLLASMTLIADEPWSLLWINPGAIKHIDISPRQTRSHQLLVHQRNQLRIAATGASPAVSQDIGNIAVVVDNGSILLPPTVNNPIDLALPTNIVFTPSSAGFDVAFASPSFDTGVGSPLTLGDDDTEEVPLSFAFPFLGVSYTSVWVNSDGNVTFGTGDAASTARDAARLIGGPPRVAPLLNDLDPSSAGSVSARVDTDRVVVTWTDVPEFGLINTNTFQVTLELNGTITLAYQSLDAQYAVIGVAEGDDEGPFNEIDLTADLPGTFAAGAIFEEFAPAHGTVVDIVELANEFYGTHVDHFDFLVTFTDFIVDLQGAFAFELNVKNETQGIGLPTNLDLTSLFGSGGELESLVMMNRIGLYWPDAGKMVDPPIRKFRFAGGASILGPPGAAQISRRARWFGTLNGDFGGHGSYTLGLNSAMSVMGQEAGHRWAAFVPFVHPVTGIGPDSLDLLGRELAHWSFFFNVTVPSSQFGGDPRSSSSEGNAIVDFGGNVFGDCLNPGETRFRTDRNELIDGYTNLDQYLLGLRLASDVGPFWYVDQPTRPVAGTSFEDFREVAAIDDVGICGKRINLTVQNIQDFPGVGPRVPAIGDEVDHDAAGTPHLDRKTMAFILLVQQGTPQSPAHAAAISQVDTFRTTWQTYVNVKATGGRGRFDTVLNPAIH
jgi:hypothetical protein